MVHDESTADHYKLYCVYANRKKRINLAEKNNYKYRFILLYVISKIFCNNKETII